MKYIEASKQIQQLSKDYTTVFEPDEANQSDSANGWYKVYYKSKSVIQVMGYTYQIHAVPELYKLPYGNKVWMIASELAMTPSDERIEEHKYNVIIGKNINSNWNTVVWVKTGEFCFEDAMYSCNVIKEHLLEHPEYQFTDDEFEDLIKYIKTLPDGEFQAKVAEHGKTLVNNN